MTFPKPTNDELETLVDILNRLQLYLSDKGNQHPNFKRPHKLYQGEIDRYRRTIQEISCWIDY